MPLTSEELCSQENPQVTVERAIQLYAVNKETFMVDTLMNEVVSRQGSDGPWIGAQQYSAKHAKQASERLTSLLDWLSDSRNDLINLLLQCRQA